MSNNVLVAIITQSRELCLCCFQIIELGIDITCHLSATHPRQIPISDLAAANQGYVLVLIQIFAVMALGVLHAEGSIFHLIAA